MKRTPWIAALFTLILTSSAFSDNICSRPVGFIRVTIPAKWQELACLPFTWPSTSVNSLFAHQLTEGADEESADHLFKWDAFESRYVVAVKIAGRPGSNAEGGWFKDIAGTEISDMTIEPGEGFFIQNRQNKAQDVILGGEVILEDTRSITLAPPLNLVGYPYSTAAAVDQTGLGKMWRGNETNGSVSGDELIDVSSNAFRDARLHMGRGYWYKRAGDGNLVWEEARPYANPFPLNGDPPYVTTFSYNTEKHALTLTISCSGKAGETFNIYYQDISVTNDFDPAGSWKLAQGRVAAGGKREIEWVDAVALGEKRAPLSKVDGRCYLVGRADIDSDTNGIPDIEEWLAWATEQRTSARVDADGGQAPAAAPSGTTNGPTGRSAVSTHTRQSPGGPYWEKLFLAGTDVKLFPHTDASELNARRQELEKQNARLEKEAIAIRRSKESEALARAWRESWQALRQALADKYPEVRDIDEQSQRVEEKLRGLTEKQSRGELHPDKVEGEKRLWMDILREQSRLALRRTQLERQHKNEFPENLAAFQAAQRKLDAAYVPVREADRLRVEAEAISLRLEFEHQAQEAVAQGFPRWWRERGIADGANRAEDCRPLKTGLLKRFVASALNELDAKLPGGGGPKLTELGRMLSKIGDDGNVNRAQLKFVARRFYDRFAETGAAACLYPWGKARVGEHDFISAEVGEMKYLFSFDAGTKRFYPVVPPEWWDPAEYCVNNMTWCDDFEVLPRRPKRGPGSVIQSVERTFVGIIPGWSREYLSNAVITDLGYSVTDVAVRVNGWVFYLDQDSIVDVTDAVIQRIPAKLELIEMPNRPAVFTPSNRNERVGVSADKP